MNTKLFIPKAGQCHFTVLLVESSFSFRSDFDDHASISLFQSANELNQICFHFHSFFTSFVFHSLFSHFQRSLTFYCTKLSTCFFKVFFSYTVKKKKKKKEILIWTGKMWFKALFVRRNRQHRARPSEYRRKPSSSLHWAPCITNFLFHAVSWRRKNGRILRKVCVWESLLFISVTLNKILALWCLLCFGKLRLN